MPWPGCALTAPVSRVRRDGGLGELPTAELVVGNVIEVEAGDPVPAAALDFHPRANASPNKDAGLSRRSDAGSEFVRMPMSVRCFRTIAWPVKFGEPP